MTTPEKCLLGKIIADTYITDKSSIISKLSMTWNNYNPTTASPWKNNFLSFVFSKTEDIQQVLDNAPWFVNGHYVSLLRWDPDKTLNEMEFDKGQFWVQVHDLPLGLLTFEYATVLAKSLGRLVELDCVGEGLQTLREFLRFRVEVDVTKPLVPGFFIQRLNGKESWAPLKYEGLRDFCDRCGCLGHCRELCTNEVISKYAGKWSSEMCTSKLQRLGGSTYLSSTSNNDTFNTSSFPSKVITIKIPSSKHKVAKPLKHISREKSPSHQSIQPSSMLVMKRKRDDLTKVLKEGEKDKPMDPDYLEVCKTLRTVTEKPCKKESTEILSRERMIVHPYFKNITVDHAIKLLSDKEPGEFIIHPKCHGPSDLTLTLKLYDGLYIHNNIIEDGKDHTDPTSSLRLGKTLKIGQAVFSNLDEVIARHVDPLVGHLKKMLGHRLFKHGTKAEIEKSLWKEKSEDYSNDVYSFSISHELPGTFILTYIRNWSVHHENIGLHPNGFSFRKIMFTTIDGLVAYVNALIYHHRQTGGSGSNTGLQFADKGMNNANQDGGGQKLGVKDGFENSPGKDASPNGSGGGRIEGCRSDKGGDGPSVQKNSTSLLRSLPNYSSLLDDLKLET